MRRPWLFLVSILTTLVALGAAGFAGTFHLAAGVCRFYVEDTPDPAEVLEACVRDERYAWALGAAALILAVVAIRLQVLSWRTREPDAG